MAGAVMAGTLVVATSGAVGIRRPYPPRMSRSSRLVPLLVLLPVAATAAGCGAGGTSAQAGPVRSTATAATQAPTPAASSGAVTPAPAAAASTAASASRTAAAPASPQAGAAQPARRTTATGPALTPPGSYTYATKGSASSAFGNQDLSGTASLVADRPSGDRQHSTLKTPNGSQEQTVVRAADGIHLADMAFRSQGFSEEFRPSTPVLFFAWPATQGRSWSWHMTSTDGKYTLDATSTVTAADQAVTVGGRQLRTVVLHTDVKVSGQDVSFTVRQDDWVDPSDALIAKEHSVTDGTAMKTKFHSDLTRTLESTQPR